MKYCTATNSARVRRKIIALEKAIDAAFRLVEESKDCPSCKLVLKRLSPLKKACTRYLEVIG